MIYARGLVHQADESLITRTLVFRRSASERIYHVNTSSTTSSANRSPWPRIYRRTGMVTVWTLHLDHHGRSWRWSQEAQFSVRSLWELEDFKKARLPENLPKCPVVMPCPVVPAAQKAQDTG
ncbi:hypothetical protein BAE44_0004490 [Dichanthelium oligosanthes]|uniref:DUF1618 domain-containing protein n=1 Tax=Dichanthelium oligosanthes TaxID=888268 RepID=A0A1E5WAP7_9POAL|nr:hypothetical protein BAE44_0004490 [Dichanthelium oligosanthes]